METAAEALHELEPSVQADIIDDMASEKASDMLEQMPPDEAADVLGDLPERKAEELIGLMEKDEAQEVKELLEHEEDTAGGLMTTEFLSFPPDITVDDAIKELRLEAPDVEAVYYLYITDDEDRLLGVLSLKNLILARPEMLLSDIMRSPVKTLPLEAQQEEVAEFISKYNQAPGRSSPACNIATIDVRSCLTDNARKNDRGTSSLGASSSQAAGSSRSGRTG